MNRISIGMLAAIGMTVSASSATLASNSLFGTCYNQTLPNGDLLYTFSAVDTVTGNATGPSFGFTISGNGGISGLAFDPNTGLFVAVTVDGSIVNINAQTHAVSQVPITGLTGPGTNFQAIEFDRALNTMLVSYGQSTSNPNLQNQLAAIDPAGFVTNNTVPLDIPDIDTMVYHSILNQLITTDPNDPPFTEIDNIFSSPTYSTYANPSDPEMYDPACSDTGVIYFSRRATQDLWLLSGDSYERIGPHDAGPGVWFQGLAIGNVPSPGSLSLVLLGGYTLLRRRRPIG